MQHSEMTSLKHSASAHQLSLSTDQERCKASDGRTLTRVHFSVVGHAVRVDDRLVGFSEFVRSKIGGQRLCALDRVNQRWRRDSLVKLQKIEDNHWEMTYNHMIVSKTMNTVIQSRSVGILLSALEGISLHA